MGLENSLPGNSRLIGFLCAFMGFVNLYWRAPVIWHAYATLALSNNEQIMVDASTPPFRICSVGFSDGFLGSFTGRLGMDGRTHDAAAPDYLPRFGAHRG
jgi:hypothetical protein